MLPILVQLLISSSPPVLTASGMATRSDTKVLGDVDGIVNWIPTDALIVLMLDPLN